MRDAVFLLGWLALLPAAALSAHLGVILWAWSSLLGANDLLYSFAAGVPFSKIASVLTIGLVLFNRGGRRFYFDLTIVLFLALAMTALISQAHTIIDDAADNGGWDLCSKFLKIILLAWMVTAINFDRLRLHSLLLAICLGIGFIGVDEALKFLASGGGHRVDGTPTVGDNNQIALDVLLIVPLLMHIFGVSQRQLVRVASIGGAGLCLVCVIASNSRGGFVGMVVMALAFAVTGKRKILSVVVIGLIALIGSQLVSHDWTERISTIQQADDDDSFVGRLTAWKVSAALAVEHPFFGGGFHAIQHPNVWLDYREKAAAFTFPETPEPRLLPRAAHSIYFEMLGDMGFVGLTLFLGLFATAWNNARRISKLVRRSGRDDLAWAADLAKKLQISLLVFLVSGSVLSAAYFDIDYLLVAIISVLLQIVKRTLAEPYQDRFVPYFEQTAAPAPPQRIPAMAKAIYGSHGKNS